MVEITLQVPESLAERLQLMREQLPDILEAGLRQNRSLSLRAYSQALEFLATAPRPEEILDFRPSPAIQTEVARLLQRSKAGSLLPEEEAELDRIGDLEHMIMALKARARQQLGRANPQ